MLAPQKWLKLNEKAIILYEIYYMRFIIDEIYYLVYMRFIIDDGVYHDEDK